MVVRYQTVVLAGVCLLLAGLQTVYAANRINDIILVESRDASKIVFNLDDTTNYDVFRLSNPDRIIVDINQTQLGSKLPPISKGHDVIKNMRSAYRNNRAQRFVIDTNGKPDYETYRLKPGNQFSHRIVLEIKRDNVSIANSNVKPKSLQQPVTIENRLTNRDIVIAIDAGHGGDDPGAIGKYGTREKDVVLKIASKLKAAIDNQPGMKAVLIRKNDLFLSLRQRIAIARREKADMFISIHADAFQNRQVQGSSVYILSEKGASDEQSKWLADQENAADLVGGVSLDDKDAMLAQVLLDLSQAATIEASSLLAGNVLSEIGQVAPVHKSSVQHARFVVLKSPDIPSLLVETAFISNPSEERRLNEEEYQDKLALAMLKGIKKYFEHNPPQGSAVAQRIQLLRVKAGDTLADLAEEHNVTVTELMRYNNLSSRQLFVGQTLRIPF